MATFQGLIRRNIVNTNCQFEKLGYITNNISNTNTTAYKTVRFEQVLNEDGYLDGVVRSDYSNGKVMYTSNKLDVALSDNGFIPVTSENGDVTYTRDGAFKLNKDGYIITNDNYLVGDGIKLPINYHDLVIKKNGDVQVIMKFGDKPETIGRIPVVNFMNPEALKRLDGNKYIPTADSGEPVLTADHNSVEQGALERSNMDMYVQVNDVMRLNASMIASFQLVKSINDLYEKSIKLQG